MIFVSSLLKKFSNSFRLMDVNCSRLVFQCLKDLGGNWRLFGTFLLFHPLSSVRRQSKPRALRDHHRVSFWAWCCSEKPSTELWCQTYLLGLWSETLRLVLSDRFFRRLSPDLNVVFLRERLLSLES